ncbi:MAG TPA: sulfite exporter TauE/SafE family protein [Dongiaceae bacterium]|nr:sulfite exporter TauE/SafE family protein [Dongiaceae bacterium]
MAPSLDLIAAFAVGFMGSLHCIGMCGGISSALTTALAPARHSLGRQLGYPLTYNLGRISSYALAGAIAGVLGAQFRDLLGIHGPSVLRIFAAVMMILLGLYLSGWWKVLNHLERAGTRVWKRLAPFTRRFIPVDSPRKALMLGMLWGWLPCGLVYSALAWSVGAGGALPGALLMLCFGLGTLPAMVGIGAFSHVLNDLARSRNTRTLAALLLIGFGVWTLLTQLPLPGGHHH